MKPAMAFLLLALPLLADTTINSDLGVPDDKPTEALYEFLDSVLKK